jgi:glycerophosphoryl diester phosphodiesterase
VRSAHREGLRVVVWTVDEPAELERMIDLRVDGIYTDYPDRLRAVMAARGLALPAPTPMSP